MRNRVARGVLVLGLIALAAWLAPHWPRQQQLVFRLGSSHARITRLEASWVRQGDAEIEGGFILNFSDPPPETVRHTLTLPSGEYTVTVELTRKGSGDTRTKTTWARRVTLGGKETTLPLGDDHP
jgi:hypothetical protein